MTTGNCEDNIIPFEVPVGMSDAGCQDDPDRTEKALGTDSLRYRIQKAMSILMNFNELLNQIESGELVDPEVPVVLDLMMAEIEAGLHIDIDASDPDEKV